MNLEKLLIWLQTEKFSNFKMAREDILGALVSAISRGESINKSKVSLENAGYSKAEIEEAIQNLNTQQIQPVQTLAPQNLSIQPQTTTVQNNFSNFQTQVKKPQAVQQVSQYGQEQERLRKLIPAIKQQVSMNGSPQKVSSYMPVPGSKQKTSIILLGLALGILSISLIAMFLFKTEIIDFFNLMLA